MSIHLKAIRRAAKVKVKDIKMDPRTVHKIENGDDSVCLSLLKVYLDTIGLELTYSLKK